MSNQQRFSGEWETKRLRDIASIRNQKVLSTNVDPNALCVELEHLGSGNGQLLERATAKTSTSSKYRFCDGDVLFGRLRSYLRKFWLADQDGICTTEIWPLMVDTKQLDSGFLHAIVQSDQFFAMASISYGTHMPRTDWGVMRNFPVMLPPIPEQRAIAEVLSDVDGLLNALEALIAKKRAIKQATMQQLLTGKTRLPGFSGAWETKRLGEITKIQKGSLITEKSVVPGPIPVIAGGQKPPYYHNTANRTGKTITVSGSGAYAGFVAFHSQPIFASDCSTISENSSFSIDFIYAISSFGLGK